MKPEELRIGNWIINDKELEQISIGMLGLISITGGDCCDYFDPIPLTPEWLERFGFEDMNRMDMFLSPCREYSYRLNGSFWVYHSIDQSFTVISKCKHVHELQNLYRALTGEEL